MLTYLLSVILAVTAPVLQAKPYTYYAIAEAQEPYLRAEGIPMMPEGYSLPPSIIASEEFKGENTAYNDFDPLNSPGATTTLKNEEILWIDGLLKHYSAQYAVSYEEMRRVMMCESNGKIDAVGDKDKAYGLFQFWENTFNLFAKDLGEKLEWKNPEHQIKLASWAFSKGKQTHWTCWKNL